MANKKTEDLKYDASAKISSKGSPILGHLEGPIADIIKPTRNGRKYSEQLWEKVFNDPIVKEYFSCGGIFGEMNHPADRQETDLTQVCICMPEPPEKKDGKLWGVFDILDTPNGRILKTLCDYGYKIGISSRGSGDVITDYDGNESVDPDTYEFNGFDIVYLPAVKAARLDYMQESLNGKTLKQALTESLNNATDSDRKIMEKTIDSLGIKLNEETKINNQDGDCDIEEVNEEETVVNDKVDLMDELQENLKLNKELENKIINLQEKLSVCYAKEAQQNEEINKLKVSISRLSENNKKLRIFKEKTDTLNEKLEKVGHLNKVSTDKVSMLENRVSKYVEQNKNLEESLTKKDNTISKLKSNLVQYNNEITQLKEQYSSKEKTLKEQLTKLKDNMEEQKNNYLSKLEESNELVEKYQRITTKVVNRYIDSQAVRLGVTSNEIKNRLPESYGLTDIDKVCEDLQSYQVTMNQLPFQTRLNEGVGIKVTSTKNNLIGKENVNLADDIDDSLLLMARLK